MPTFLLLCGLSRKSRNREGFPALLERGLGAVVVCVDDLGFGSEHRRVSPSALPDIAPGSFRPDVRRELAILQRVTKHPSSDRAEPRAGSIAEQCPSNASLAKPILAARADNLVSASSSHVIAAPLRAPVRSHETAGNDLSFDDGPWAVRQVADWLCGPAAETAA
jgi:hypothetical protein